MFKLVIRYLTSLNGRFLTTSRQCTNQAEEWFKASANGNVQVLTDLIKENSKAIYLRDNRGWTALMHSAKNGQLECVKLLAENGSKQDTKTRMGQTALDLALFWRQTEIASYIANETAPGSETSIYFTHTPIRRNAVKRGNDMWLFEAMRNPGTKYVLMHRCKPLVCEPLQSEAKIPKHKLQLLLFDIIQSHTMIDDNRQNLIFLGEYEGGTQQSSEGQAYFAVDISDEDLKAVQKEHENAFPLSVYPGVLQLSAEEAAVIGQARSLFDWHFRYSYCPTCGSKTTSIESGYKRICNDKTCLSHTGVYNTNYPRTDASVITAVLAEDSERCLLGRKRAFPPGMYTCLAGFVEPGESVEMACAREVEEESGVTVTRVEYVASQPWPMPNQLMLGCLSYTPTASAIKLDTNELEDAKWFSREDVVQMLTMTHPQRLFVPPPQAIAHQLLKVWAIKTA